MGKYSNPSGLSCSFCHKSQKEVDKIIAGPNVYICSECIRLCLDIIRENTQQKPVSWGHSGVPVPAKIKAYLDQYVVGQDAAKRKISVAVYNHYKRLEANASGEGEVEVAKSNVLLVGPTGTGKTLMASTLAKFLDVPFVIADATTLTEAGYVGEDVENIILNLYQGSNNNLERTQRGIVYIDEIDKLTKKNFTSSVSRDVSGEGVQQALLKILEGTVSSIQVRGNKRLPNQEHIQVDTTNILFIVGGSFEGLERIIEQRIGRRTVGFTREAPLGDRLDEEAVEERRSLLQRVTASDLDKFGLIPEFIGRLPVLAVMDRLGVDDLVHVLTEPKNALVKQYQKLFKFEKVTLRFTEGAIRGIAEQAVKRKSGARGLRAIMESVMLEVMYEVPSVEGISEVVITEDVVEGKGEPEFQTVQEYGAG